VEEDAKGSGLTARWLAWATAGLLMAGLVSAGTVAARNAGTGDRIVSAAGTGADGVESPPPPAPTVPPSTTAPSTSVAPTTSVPMTSTAPPTTQRPRPTTTTSTTVKATTSTTGASSAAGRATVTVVNQAADAFVITLNGRTFQLAPGQQAGPVEIDLYAHGNDIVEIRAVADPSCGMGDADNYFDAGGHYRVAIVPSQGMCGSMPGPQLKVTPA
jgi:hypothetical protein